ncbi:hypothetical protein [Streptomyces sp. NPDC006285]|uniref:hypothetical protein n=1 Tax=Streptomyces sp. NPDC006285 TaxID=3364742 RepID=UPI0036746823
MSPDLPPTPAQYVMSLLDHRIEIVTGRNTGTLWAHRDRGLLNEEHAALVDRHRELVQAETDLTFYRVLLNRLTSGEFPLDAALFLRIERTVEQIEQAADARDAVARQVLGALEPIEAAATTAAGGTPAMLSAHDQAALLAIADGAKLHEHILTGQLSATTASGARVSHADVQRLQSSGLLDIDTSYPVHAGQPIVLTDAARTALTARRPQPTHKPTPLPRSGTQLASPKPRH